MPLPDWFWDEEKAEPDKAPQKQPAGFLDKVFKCLTISKHRLGSVSEADRKEHVEGLMKISTAKINALYEKYEKRAR